MRKLDFTGYKNKKDPEIGLEEIEVDRPAN